MTRKTCNRTDSQFSQVTHERETHTRDTNHTDAVRLCAQSAKDTHLEGLAGLAVPGNLQREGESDKPSLRVCAPRPWASRVREGHGQKHGAPALQGWMETLQEPQRQDGRQTRV